MRRRARTYIVIVSTLLSVVAAEVVLRGFFPRRTAEALAGIYPAMFDDSAVLPYRLRPNYSGPLVSEEYDTRININARGHRGKDFAVEKGAAKRVLVIGDSFTFGWGVNDDQAYPAVLQKRLTERVPSEPIEVINAGFAACYSPDTYYLYLKTEGLALRPDAIVVGLYVGNDLDNDQAFENEWFETDAKGLPRRIRNIDSHVVDHFLMPRQIPVRYRTPVLSGLHLYQGLFDIWWEVAPRIKSWLPHSVAATVYADSQPPGADEQVPFNYRRRYADRTQKVFDRVRSLLAGMHQIASDQGIPIYFMVIPARVQMSTEAFPNLPADIERPQKELAAFFDARGMKYLDLLPWLRQQSEGRDVYYPADGHFNVLGNELTAERLSGFLEEVWLSQ